MEPGPKPFTGSHQSQQKSPGIRKFSSHGYNPHKEIAEIEEPVNFPSGTNEMAGISVGKGSKPSAQPMDKCQSLANLSNFLSADELKVNSTVNTKESSLPADPTPARVNPHVERLASFLSNEGNDSVPNWPNGENGKEADDDLDDVLLDLEKSTNEMTQDILDLHRLSLERDRHIAENNGLSKLNHSNKSAFSEYNSSRLEVTAKNSPYLKPIASLGECFIV